MNCIYCHQELSNDDKAVSQCLICSSSEFLIQYWFYFGEVVGIEFIATTYVINLDISTSECRVSTYSPKLEILCQLNYLPFISPTNVLDWIKRIDNLVVFS